MNGKIKTFAKKHEALIKAGVNFASAAVELGCLIVLIKDSKYFDKSWRCASKDAKVYLPAHGEELMTLIEPYKGVIDADGRKIDVTGAILFGNFAES